MTPEQLTIHNVTCNNYPSFAITFYVFKNKNCIHHTYSDENEDEMDIHSQARPHIKQHLILLRYQHSRHSIKYSCCVSINVSLMCIEHIIIIKSNTEKSYCHSPSFKDSSIVSNICQCMFVAIFNNRIIRGSFQYIYSVPIIANNESNQKEIYLVCLIMHPCTHYL